MLIAGFSASVIDISLVVMTVVINKQVLRYGNESALAVFGVTITCSFMFQRLFSGVGQAIQPIVSMNFGAGQIQRIREVDKLSVITALLMGALFTLVGLLFPLQLTAFFVDTTPQIIEIAPKIVRIYFLSFLPMGVNIQATYYLQSVMQTKWSSILTLLRGLIISVSLVYLLPIWLEIDGVWWAMVITEFIVVIFSAIFLRTADKTALQKHKA